MAFIKLKNGSVNEIPDTPDWEKRFKDDLEPEGAVYCLKDGSPLSAKSQPKPKDTAPPALKAKPEK